MAKIVTKKKAATQAITAWSFSRLTAYENCPLKFKLTVIDKLKEPASPAMERGKNIHTQGELFLKGTVAGVPESFKLLAVEMEDARVHAAESELEVTFNKDWGITGWFEPDAWLRIKIDVLLRKDDTVRIIDLKTGKNRGGYEDQLELYCLAALIMYPELDSVMAELWFVDSGEVIGTSHGDYKQKDVKKLKKKWENRAKPMFVDDVWAPRPNEYCGYCPFKKGAGNQCVF